MKEILPDGVVNEETIGDPGLVEVLRGHVESMTTEIGFAEWFKRHRRAIVGLGGLSLAITGFATGGIVAAHHH